ncbi:OLC1v1020174C2 [Oldenlandia corymbosa var. corymbosa]|uniref:OLC1v1020174C2 n=1 Tax=Oldenlandia corymbosa var. corymbosa TaxID=529605 RepID=A0AAV1EFY4_OLDCO|nr:OLC1v1020174C2 [Oldenlandia corymbosa var. corymbosa]
MKTSLEDQPPAHVAIETQESYETKNDREMEANNITNSNEDEMMKQPLFNRMIFRMALAEAIGSFIIVFSVSAILASLELMGTKGGLMEYAATAGLSVVIVVFAFGEISGAHVNPAVTMAFAVVGSFPWFSVLVYIIAQFGGCVLGSFAGRIIYGINLELLMTKPPQEGWAAAFFVEFMATSILVFLAATFSSNTQPVGKLAGFVMGTAIGLGVILTGYINYSHIMTSNIFFYLLLK